MASATCWPRTAAMATGQGLPTLSPLKQSPPRVHSTQDPAWDSFWAGRAPAPAQSCFLVPETSASSTLPSPAPGPLDPASVISQAMFPQPQTVGTKPQPHCCPVQTLLEVPTHFSWARSQLVGMGLWFECLSPPQFGLKSSRHCQSIERWGLYEIIRLQGLHPPVFSSLSLGTALHPSQVWLTAAKFRPHGPVTSATFIGLGWISRCLLLGVCNGSEDSD